jgi:tetratricopeptide (TPR) repeat protein
MQNKININHQKQILFIYIALTVVTLAVFWQVYRFDFVNYDDPVYVTENVYVQSGMTLEGLRWAFSTTYAEFWHPLTWLSLMLDNRLYGLNAGGYHLTNLILHILSTLLLFWLFKRMTGAIWKSAFVAALFALHPLHVESVAWITKRKDVLSAFFWMLTLCFYVYYTEKPVIKRYLLVLFSFLLALLSKPMVVTLPVIMLLFDYWPLGRLQSQKIENNLTGIIPVSANKRKNKTKTKKGALKENISLHNDRKLSETKIARIIPLWQLQEKMPFFVLSAVFSIITVYAHNKPFVIHFPFGSRIANAPVSFVTYLEKTFWPHHLASFYPFSDLLPVWQVLGAVLLIIVISTVVIIAVRRLPYLFVGWLWYSITLLPVIGIIQTGNRAMSDNYTYLPSIGVGIMLAWDIPLFFQREDIRKKILFPSAIIVLAVITILSWQQCRYWKNSGTLFNHALQVTKDNYLAHNNLAAVLLDEGKIDDALDHCNKAILIKPDYAYAYGNRGLIYAKLGQYQLAIEEYNKAIRLKPDYEYAYSNRGNAFVKFGQFQSAIDDFNEAIRLNPDYAKAYYNRGTAYAKFNRHQLAIEDYNEAIRLKPDYALTYNNRGASYTALGQYQLAIEDYDEAIRFKPDYVDAYNNRGTVYLNQGNNERGCSDVQKACALGNCKALELANLNGLCR